jgi:shikimate dehydrogenase
MSFNDTLDFIPTIESLKKLDHSFHILLSGYLRQSKTFQLYDAIFKMNEKDAAFLPFELSASSNSDIVLEELIGLLRTSRHMCSIMVSDPFKQAVGSHVDEVTPQALNCGSVNMIYKKDQKIVGDNRDGEAFLLGARAAHSFDFENKRMLFFGCGGVSSAVAVALSKSLKIIGLIDLHREKATELEAIICGINPEMRVRIFDTASARNLEDFDVLYNGTGLGKGAMVMATAGPSPLNVNDILPKGGAGFDANYTPERTFFLLQLDQLGFAVYNGLSHMLSSTVIHLNVITKSNFTYQSVESLYKAVFES